VFTALIEIIGLALIVLGFYLLMPALGFITGGLAFLLLGLAIERTPRDK